MEAGLDLSPAFFVIGERSGVYVPAAGVFRRACLYSNNYKLQTVLGAP